MMYFNEDVSGFYSWELLSLGSNKQFNNECHEDAFGLLSS